MHISESISVEIETDDFEKTLIGVLFSPPDYSNIDLFNEYLKTILHRLSKTKNPSFIMGDFNIDMLNIIPCPLFTPNPLSFDVQD